MTLAQEAEPVSSGVELDLNFVLLWLFSAHHHRHISPVLSCAYVGAWFSRRLLSMSLVHLYLKAFPMFLAHQRLSLPTLWLSPSPPAGDDCSLRLMLASQVWEERLFCYSGPVSVLGGFWHTSCEGLINWKNFP